MFKLLETKKKGKKVLRLIYLLEQLEKTTNKKWKKELWNFSRLQFHLFLQISKKVLNSVLFSFASTNKLYFQTSFFLFYKIFIINLSFVFCFFLSLSTSLFLSLPSSFSFLIINLNRKKKKQEKMAKSLKKRHLLN